MHLWARAQIAATHALLADPDADDDEFPAVTMDIELIGQMQAALEQAQAEVVTATEEVALLRTEVVASWTGLGLPAQLQATLLQSMLSSDQLIPSIQRLEEELHLCGRTRQALEQLGSFELKMLVMQLTTPGMPTLKLMGKRDAAAGALREAHRGPEALESVLTFREKAKRLVDLLAGTNVR
jgi:hypothetical protein